MPYEAKLELFQRAIDQIAADFTFVTLEQWASTFDSSSYSAGYTVH